MFERLLVRTATWEGSANGATIFTAQGIFIPAEVELLKRRSCLLASKFERLNERCTRGGGERKRGKGAGKQQTREGERGEKKKGNDVEGGDSVRPLSK